MDPSKSRSPIWGDTCPLLKCYDCGTVAFQSSTTSPTVVFASLRIPICRSPMHVRDYSSTSPLPHHPIRYHKFVIPNAKIPLSLETPKCQTLTPLDPRTRVLKSNGSDLVGKSRIAISMCKSFLTPETLMLRFTTSSDLLPRVLTDGRFKACRYFADHDS
jgi:hypothetical protein